MPEGDAVVRACRRLHGALAGRTLMRAELRVPAYATVDLVGAQVLEVVPRGKHQLFRFADGRTLRTHLRLDGTWLVSARSPSERPSPRSPSERQRVEEHHIRVLFATTDHLVTGLRIHDIAVVPTSAEHTLVGHLGPDLLGPDWDLDEAVRRVVADGSRSIGEALLDQRNLAGLGTIYRAESLYLQGIHPRTPVSDLEPAKLRRLVQRAQLLLRANVEGTTRRVVFERTGRPCARCGTPVAHEEYGPPGQERHSYWCPHCQPGPPPSRE